MFIETTRGELINAAQVVYISDLQKQKSTFLNGTPFVSWYSKIRTVEGDTYYIDQFEYERLALRHTTIRAKPGYTFCWWISDEDTFDMPGTPIVAWKCVGLHVNAAIGDNGGVFSKGCIGVILRQDDGSCFVIDGDGDGHEWKTLEAAAEWFRKADKAQAKLRSDRKAMKEAA